MGKEPRQQHLATSSLTTIFSPCWSAFVRSYGVITTVMTSVDCYWYEEEKKVQDGVMTPGAGLPSMYVRLSIPCFPSLLTIIPTQSFQAITGDSFKVEGVGTPNRWCIPMDAEVQDLEGIEKLDHIHCFVKVLDAFEPQSL